MVPSPSLPESYNTLTLPGILLSHHPSTSTTPTPIIIITLHRPASKNAFTDTMATSLVAAFSFLSTDPRVKAIILTGHGSIFCAGADLSTSFNYTHDTPHTHRDGGGQVALAIHRCTKPVIAALNGSAVGIGITMTLPCAIRVVSSRAKIGFVFARRGIVMEACSSYFLPRLIGYSKAMHLITTGAVYLATDPLLSDLFTEIVEPGDVLSRAVELAEDISRNTSGVSWALMRDMMWRAKGTAEEQHLLESRLLFDMFRGKDKEEGVDSFLEKRGAVFKGNMGRDAPSVWPWWGEVDVGVEKGDGVKSKL